MTDLLNYKNLDENENELFGLIIEDLHCLFNIQEILPENIPDILSKLKSDEVKAYIDSLSKGSKPETALREAFFAGRSLLSKYLGGETTPEVNLGPGFVDYILGINGRFILIELKALYESEFEEGEIRRLKRLKQRELKPQEHKFQVLKYIQKGSEFIILTNLKNWFFFDKDCNQINFKYFFTVSLFSFVEEYNMIGNVWDYLERKYYQATREGLDKRFFENLEIWVTKLSEVEFDVDGRTKLEVIIRLLNKFMFIQTLDDLLIIDPRRIKTYWDEIEHNWRPKGKERMLTEFFKVIDMWFYDYYDTELFRIDVLEHVKRNSENIDKLYENLQLVLGTTYWQTKFSGFKGIMQYKFQFIDEDIFGKAYETFLANIRHDEGIFYTPKYITEYIVDNTVGKLYDTLLFEIDDAIEIEDFLKAKQLLRRFTSVKILDPACGSGSFLIKALRKIMDKYNLLNESLKKAEAKYKYKESLIRPIEIEEKHQQIEELIDIVKTRNKRELISRLLLRHIYGNDLDSKALEVAKVNIWLEAIKLAPSEFRFDKLPEKSNHILPDLEMNLVNGNTVVGLPERIALNFLCKSYGDKILELSKLREQYLENPNAPKLVEKIVDIKSQIRGDVDEEFKRYLSGRSLSTDIVQETRPLHWPLEMWYLYFIDNGLLDENTKGADVIIGNPPYERIQVLKKKSPGLVDFFDTAGFVSTTKNYDLAVIFMEKGYELLRQNGNFGFIVTNKFITADYGEGIRKFISESHSLNQLVNFGDQQVFDDATTYTAIVFLNKGRNKEFKYGLIRKLERTLEQLYRIKEQNAISGTEQTSILDVASLSEKPWALLIGDEEKLSSKINSIKNLSEFKDRIFQGLVTGADSVFILQLKGAMEGLVRVHSNSLNKEYLLEKDLIRPLLKGKDIKQWYVNEYDEVVLFPYIIVNNKASLVDEKNMSSKYPKIWAYLLENRNMLESREGGKWKVPCWYAFGRRQNLEQFDQPKIMTQVLANKSSFAIDLKDNFYFVGGGNAGGYGITLKSHVPISLPFLCALLNSNLLDWYLKKISTRFRGGFYSYAKRFIERLPIKIPETETERELAKIVEETVARIITLKSKRLDLLNLWDDVSTRLKNGERSLSRILLDDHEEINGGNFNNVWTSRVTFYPDSRDVLLKKKFNDFTIVSYSSECILKIHGLSDEGKEEEIYELKFKDKLLMSHVYYCLVSTLSSRSKISTLEQLLNKTWIPVIQPDMFRNTANIIKKLQEEIIGKAEEPTLEVDIADVDSSIIDYEAKINAIVLKLYSLDLKETYTIMQSLGLLESFQELVLKYLK